MNSKQSVVSRLTGLVAAALVVAGAVVLPTAPAVADTAPSPATETNPKTVSTDPLPTVQINGVVWSQVVVGNRVYVGGEFTQARPAGAAAGTNQTPRANLLAYDIRTGQLINEWKADTNGTVNAVAASPDGSRIYAGGTFTTVNGQTYRRIVALNPTTGAPISSFAPNPDARVRAIAATNSTVYFGGNFGRVSNLDRGRLAAASASNGQVLDWQPSASDVVWALAVSPDESQVLVGGEFTTLNGSSNPGYGLGSVSASNGQLLPWAANSVVRNATPTNQTNASGAITAFSTKGNSVYANGYTWQRAGGSLEGTVKMSWDGGTIEWLEDCHGDSYANQPFNGAVYVVAHKHYCGNLPDGWPQTDTWKYYRGTAFLDKPTQVLRQEYYGYYNFEGQPAPSLLHWFPEIDAGTYTGQGQGPWHITGNDDYLVVGGEFPRVERRNQQGLVRFARPEIAPNNELFDDNGSNTNPTVRSVGDGQVVIGWKSNFDRDNEKITYKIIRNGNIANPIETRTVSSTDWDQPYQSFLDTGLTPGSTATYRLFTSDPWGNETRSDTISVTVAGSGDAGAYGRAVIEDGPQHFWRFDETGGSTVAGYTGLDDLSTQSGVSLNQTGAVGSGASFGGSSTGTSANSIQTTAPFWYSVEAWFNTTTNRGGKIVGFGNNRTTASGSGTSDHALYMDNSGRILFGSRQGGASRTVQSGTGLNNGSWHHAVGVQTPDGMELYIDGQRVATRSDTRTGRAFPGYWRVGGDTLSGWTNRPSSDYFSGRLDEVAVYTHPLSGNRVRAHYLAGGGSLGTPTAGYAKAVYDSGPQLYWRLGESSGTTANDISGNGQNGAYLNGVTLGQGSAVGESSDRSVRLDGNDDNVTPNAAMPSTTRFSAETWFRTDTTTGGRLIGFGNNRTGASTTTDRAVYMTPSGNLRFGTWWGSTESSIRSPKTYNDNQWHHVVATQGVGGMDLYVDGVPVASNPSATSRVMNGYWRLGGDSLANWTERPSGDYFAGQLDEAAVYSRALGAAEVAQHFTAGGGTPANQAPVPAFDSTVSNLQVAFDSTASKDPDGTIASYQWSFGDGTSSTQANPTKNYSAAGDYTVTLTVTDNDGASASTSRTVTTTAPPMQSPTASFTATPSGLSVNVDGSGSSDPDGTIASYRWTWGDGTPATTGASASSSHAYSTEGTYTVTLTVTDNDGLTDTTTRSVTVSAPGTATTLAADNFGRSVSGGWGSADTGGAWTVTGPASRWSVANGQGVYTAPEAGRGNQAFLDGVNARDLQGSVDVTMDKPVTGTGILWTQIVRRNANTYYQLITRLQTGGEIRAWISRVVNGTETEIATRVTVPGGTFSVGDTLRMKFAVTGASPTTLQLKVWKVGNTEPAGWATTASDSTAGLQTAGSVGLYTYLFGSATNAPVQTRFDNLDITTPGGGGPAPNQPPSASFTTSASDLTVGVNASASSDPEGGALSYSWNWGDSTAPGSGVSASHTYGSAGTYTVTLTVTDDKGATDTATRSVTVGSPGTPLVVAADAFGRSVSNGWGSADTGGAWTTTGSASRWSVAGGQGVFTAEAPGRGNRAFLDGVSARDLQGSMDVTMDKPVTGTGILWTQIVRRNGDTYYQLIIRIQSGGEIRAWISRVVDGTETEIASRVTVPGGTMALGDTLRMKYAVTGASPTALQLKVWKVGNSEPSGWATTASDSTAGLQGAGGVGVYTYLFGSATNAPVQSRFDNLEITAP